MLEIVLDTKDFDIKFPKMTMIQKERVKTAILKTGARMVGRIKEVAPVDTHHLKNSINQYPKLSKYYTKITTKADYDIYNEVRKPFIMPSIKKETPGFINEIRNALR